MNIGDTVKTGVVCYPELILICIVGTTAGEQCFDQCPIVGGEDFVRGWYPFLRLT